MPSQCQQLKLFCYIFVTEVYNSLTLCYDEYMTTKDVQSVKNLYYFHNYLPSSIARLYGVSHVIILRILNGRQESPIITNIECLICGNEDCLKFYIDGNNNNNKPQNIIMLCEYDKRRLKHMQLRRTKKTLTPPSL